MGRGDGRWGMGDGQRCIARKDLDRPEQRRPVALRHFSQQDFKSKAGFQHREIYSAWDDDPGCDRYSQDLSSSVCRPEITRVISR
jgi:hypothetical protein